MVGIRLRTPDSETGKTRYQEFFSGIGSMFKSIRICSNLVQVTALVKAISVDMPKTMRIFVQLRIRVRA